jgi:hypothetical protein
MRPSVRIERPDWVRSEDFVASPAPRWNKCHESRSSGFRFVTPFSSFPGAKRLTSYPQWRDLQVP